MATLEKIRSKQKLLFSIVLGALVLFIISIIDANSIRNLFGMGPGSTVAKVGNVKVDYENYRKHSEQNSNLRQNQNQDNAEVSQQTISQLLFEGLLNKQFDDLGIKVTDAEISRAMTGETPHPEAQRFITQLSQALGITPSGKGLLNAISNPAQFNLSKEQLDMMAQQYYGAPSMLAVWGMQEKAVEDAIKKQVFGNLISGLFTANTLDAKTTYDHLTNTANVSYVTVPYSTVNDSEIKIEEADLKAKYEEVKSMFKIGQPTRVVDYVVVNVVPSADDYTAAELEVDEAVTKLTNDANAVLPGRFYKENPILIPADQAKGNMALTGIADSLMVAGSVHKSPLMQNKFRIVKINDVSEKVDSVNYSIYAAQTAAEIDSIMGKIQAGETSFAALAEANQQAAADSLWEQIAGVNNAMVDQFKTATVGQLTAYSDTTNNMYAVFRINERKAPKKFIDATSYSYTVDPSATTNTDILTQLNSFVASNSSAERFSANADSLYQLRSATIAADSPKLGNTPGTRHAVNWAMNAKKGQVSPVFDDNNGKYYVVVAVKDIYDGDYMPFSAEEVQKQLKDMVTADKKAEKLIAKYQNGGKTIEEYAQKMNAEVVNDPNVVFASQRLGSLNGNEYVLQAKIAGAKPGTIVGPVAGANEVMVFVVNGVSKNERPYNFNQDSQTFMSNFTFNDPFTLLAGKDKVKNNLSKFENYDNK